MLPVRKDMCNLLCYLILLMAFALQTKTIVMKMDTRALYVKNTIICYM